MSALPLIRPLAPPHLRLVSTDLTEAVEMDPTTQTPKPKRTEPKTEKTKTPGVYRRGGQYLYVFRVEGRQRWGSAESYDEARREKREADAGRRPSRAGLARRWRGKGKGAL